MEKDDDPHCEPRRNRLSDYPDCKLGIRTLAIYSEPDSASQHVVAADEAFLLKGEARHVYQDGDQIIALATQHGAQAILPGYGFLSENAEFARRVASAGLAFAGPTAEVIECFGTKHKARELAIKAGVPVVPGSVGLVASADDAVLEADKLGYPVMLKATAGGGGMGLLVCHNEDEVRKSFDSAKSRASALFHNDGVFLERYFPNSRHIEVQIFGDGQGGVISLGERECSIQRRHQKVIEECPSPFVLANPQLRKGLIDCAVSLAASVKYGCAGTVEFLVDDKTGDFFFLEMNTRLQVEHGVTELCYDVDLVELMLRYVDCQLQGLDGLDSTELQNLQSRCLEPRGHAIEARVYAENPARDFAPSPGLLQEVSWHQPPGARIGNNISSDYDPLIAKVIYHGLDRNRAIDGLKDVLSQSSICGPSNNMDWLQAVIQEPDFIDGKTTTNFLELHNFTIPGIDILSGGSYTLVQDHPGRPTVGHGFGHAGPMDPVAFQAANILVGNPSGMEGLEITLTGPELLFSGDAIVALCGPPVSAHIDGEEFTLWTRHRVQTGQKLAIGKLPKHCRVYLGIYGGFKNVATWFGSKSTNPMANVGGYQGRPLRAGDFLRIVDADSLPEDKVTMPQHLWPRYTSEWVIQVMSGPYETGYLSPKDSKQFLEHTWEVSHNSARGGIRLLGPRPEFARKDGGDGGSHPSNVIEYGYPIGGINWTGDEPVILPVDCPDLGGFICSHTVIKADFWKLGQLRAGDRVTFKAVSLEAALLQRRRHDDFLEYLTLAVRDKSWDNAVPFDSGISSDELADPDSDVVQLLDETSTRPKVSYRAGGDDYILVDYADGSFDLNYKCRVTVLQRLIESSSGSMSLKAKSKQGAINNMVGCGSSLAIYFDGLMLPREELVQRLITMEGCLGDLETIKLPNRRIRLPVTFTHKKLVDAMERYSANQRSIASYLPDPAQFVAENNGMTIEELRRMLLNMETVVIGVESPGGYMPLGMSIPGLDFYGTKIGFRQDKPWLFQDMDVVSFYEVSETEYDGLMAQFRAGTYRFDVHDGIFDMAAHNKLLKETEEECRILRKQRNEAQRVMSQREKELLNKWLAEKETRRPDFDFESAMAKGEFWHKINFRS
ncbi:hypothetical protein HIM_07530 [Hirsutella minnesotensis 3608]|uniref:Urea carboxylase n=1 Tax=Hirsutella minnesotensis 3608 TaxID=1043627 RepID=A0A0F7ZHU6_9HYPO|nr:hypothetical protein HIM_07530 [Hirsutella minnesotensis 3608]